MFGGVGLLVMALGALLIVAPQLYLSLYLSAYTADHAFAAQRLAPAVIGLGGVMWAARTLPPGPFAASFGMIAAGVWMGVAATGVFHFLSGVANVNILVAAATEVVLAALFAYVSRQVRHT